MDISNYAYVNEKDIDGEMICSICNSPFIDPDCTPCRHTFCRKCITPWFHGGGNSCPICRADLLLGDLRPASHMVYSLLDHLEVKCLLCDQSGLQRGQFQVHVTKSCPKEKVASSSNSEKHRCRVYGCANGLNHAQCTHCHQYFCSLHLTQHSAQCQRQERRGLLPDVPPLWVALVFLIAVILYKANSKIPSNESTEVAGNKSILAPILCANPSQCLTRQVPFQDSQLLTDEHQHYLNYFYNQSEIHLLKWDLIYRGSKDGFNAVAFHTHCDNRGETLIVLSTTKGYLFGGYTDVNWTTPAQGLPIYGRSTKTFLFSLVNHEKSSLVKFLLDARHQNYAIVSDFLSGPIFGAMMRPDIGVFDSNGEFKCQINFPSLYRGAVGGSYFPTTDDCIINEIEVFIPVLMPVSGKILPMIYGFFKSLFSLLITAITCFVFLFVDCSYDEGKKCEGRYWVGLCLFLLWINCLYGYLIFLTLIFSIILFVDWVASRESDNFDDARMEKRFLMSSLVILLIFLTFIL